MLKCSKLFKILLSKDWSQKVQKRFNFLFEKLTQVQGHRKFLFQSISSIDICKVSSRNDTTKVLLSNCCTYLGSSCGVQINSCFLIVNYDLYVFSLSPYHLHLHWWSFLAKIQAINTQPRHIRPVHLRHRYDHFYLCCVTTDLYWIDSLSALALNWIDSKIDSWWFWA